MENSEMPEKYFAGQEYIEDKDRVSMRFDINLYSPAELLPFDFFYKNLRINGIQKGRYLTVSFIEKLPRKLIDDIAWGRNNAEQYVFGCLFIPLKRINQEILRQRYTLGHFLASTFSFFDIASIRLTNVDENPTDEIINIPWPPIFPAPPYPEIQNPPIFLKDYIDAWNDYFRGDYDNCTRRLITSVENAFNFYGLNKKEKHPWWRLFSFLFAKKPTFKQVILNLKRKSKFIGHEVVSDNLLFIYKVRNRISHGSLRIHQENGWWFCGKGLETLQYLYQFIDKGGENSPGFYAFRTYAFADFLHTETRGVTIDQVENRGKFINDSSMKHEDCMIRNDEDMNNFKFNNLRINEKEQNKILNNKPRE